MASTLSRQVRAGRIRSHEGGVKLSEILADREANINAGKAHRRGRKAPSTAAIPEGSFVSLVAKPTDAPEVRQLLATCRDLLRLVDACRAGVIPAPL